MNIFKSIINNCKSATNAKIDQLKAKYIAKQIHIEDLAEQLTLLSEGKTDFDFIGINAKGDDTLYFVNNDQYFNLEFATGGNEQIAYFEKLKDFASENNFKFEIKTENEIPYLNIKTNSTLSETVALAKRIRKEIFGNADDTKYDVVP